MEIRRDINIGKNSKKYNELARQGRSDYSLIISKSQHEDSDFPTSSFEYESANDEHLVFNLTWNGITRILWSILPILSIFFMIAGWIDGIFIDIFHDTGIWAILLFFFLFVILVIPSILLLTYIIINPCRKVIFNRLEGTITMPAYKWKWFSKKTVTQQFDKTRFYTLPYRSGWGDIAVGILGTVDGFSICAGMPEQRNMHFSALVWYMDRNRPLPPNKVFDPYREKDYNRRKAEGFPEALFPSTVNTPEWDGADEERKMQLEKLREIENSFRIERRWW